MSPSFQYWNGAKSIALSITPEAPVKSKSFLPARSIFANPLTKAADALVPVTAPTVSSAHSKYVYPIAAGAIRLNNIVFQISSVEPVD